MPDISAFEEALNDLVQKTELGDIKRLEAFKAKGDAALICGDLSAEADDEFYFDNIQALVSRFGVRPEARLKEDLLWYFWPDKAVIMRDFSVGELKEVVRIGQWPEDAFTDEKCGLWTKIKSLVVTLFSVALILGGALSLGQWLINWLK